MPTAPALNLTQPPFFLSKKKLQVLKKRVTGFFKACSFVLDKKKGGWVKFNAGAVGMFRIDYSQFLLEKLKAPIEEKELSAPDRFSIQNDAFALAESGGLATSAALNLAPSFPLEGN